MTKWREIIENQDYQDLPLGEKIKTKNEFFKNIISQSDKFKKLSPQKQGEIRTAFFTSKPEEKLEPFLPEKPSLGQIAKYAVEEFQQKSPFALLDRPVEQVARFIEPDTAQEGLAGALKFIPRQMAADFIRGYKPSSVGPFYAGAKVAGAVAKPVGRFIASKTPEAIKKVFKPMGEVLTRNLTVGKGKPVAYQKMAQEAQLAREAGGREAQEAATILSTKPTGKPLSIPEQQYLGRIFRKETIESPALLSHPRYQELKSIANQGRAIQDKWSLELAKSGIPKAEAKKVIEENIGSYMARMYSSKLKPETELSGTIKNLRLRLGGLKHRKDLSSEVRNLMGEIKEPALPTAIRVKQTSANIANNKLFNSVAQNPEWVADTNVTGKMVKMPEGPSMGALRGKWVIPEIGEDINAITQVGKQADNLYLRGLSAWKYGKVVLNPAAQIRNVISNTMLLDLSGTNHLRQLQLFPRVFTQYLSKGNLYKQALEDGAIGGEYVGSETMQKLRDFYINSQGGNLQRWVNLAKVPFRKLGEFYQGMEQMSKMVKYADVLKRGGTRQLAAKEAQKWLFNYQEIPKAIELTKKYFAPFVTFTYKSTPRIAEALVNRPMTVYKYKALFDAINETSRKYQGMSPVEFARQKRVLPSYLQKDIGGIPTNLLMPWKDKYGRTQWFNLEYILPVGMAPEIMEKGILKGGLSNPVVNLIADLQKNRDYRDQPILPLEGTKMENAKAIASYIYRQLAPNLAPAIPPITKGGYSFEKIIDAVEKRPDFAERTKDLTPVLMDVLAGIKITPLDVDEAENFKMFDKMKRIRELEISSQKLNHPAISEKFREKETEKIFQKMQKIMDEK